MDKFSLEWYYFLIFFIYSVFTVFCLILLLYYIFIGKRILGANIRKILLITVTVTILLPAGNAINAYASVFSPGSFRTPWIRYFCGSGGHMFRLTALAILIERIVATYYAKIYERHKYLKHTDLIASFACVAISLAIPGFTVFLAIPDTVIIIFITLSLFAIVFLTMFLVRKNRELRRLTRMNPLLNHRYQLAMNLRLLSLLQPFIIFVAFINLIGVIILYIVAFTTKNFLYGYNALYYVYYTGIYCIAAYISYKYYKDTKYNKVKCIRSVTVTNVENNVKVLTTMGDYLPTKQTLDTYFTELHSAWK